MALPEKLHCKIASLQGSAEQVAERIAKEGIQNLKRVGADLAQFLKMDALAVVLCTSADVSIWIYGLDDFQNFELSIMIGEKMQDLIQKELGR